MSKCGNYAQVRFYRVRFGACRHESKGVGPLRSCHLRPCGPALWALWKGVKMCANFVRARSIVSMEICNITVRDRLRQPIIVLRCRTLLWLYFSSPSPVYLKLCLNYFLHLVSDMFPHICSFSSSGFSIGSVQSYIIHSKNTRVSRDPEKGPLGPISIPGQRWPGNQSNLHIMGSDWPRSGSYFASSWLISGSSLTRNGVWP